MLGNNSTIQQIPGYNARFSPRLLHSAPPGSVRMRNDSSIDAESISIWRIRYRFGVDQYRIRQIDSVSIKLLFTGVWWRTGRSPANPPLPISTHDLILDRETRINRGTDEKRRLNAPGVYKVCFNRSTGTIINVPIHVLRDMCIAPRPEA